MSQQRTKLVVGNWKMHGRLVHNIALLQAMAKSAAALPDGVQIAICVPYPYLAQTQSLLQDSRIVWGVQDISAHTQGAYTGEVAAEMAADFDASFAIIGHSERRTYHGESAELVAIKTHRALAAGLVPIVCVGETLDQHEAGTTETIVKVQLSTVLAQLSPEEAARIIVAYEPVWAIGSNRSATTVQAQRVHAFLRTQLTIKGIAVAHVPLLYGGGIKPETAEELFCETDIDGGLIGSASLKESDFIAICAAAANAARQL